MPSKLKQNLPAIILFIFFASLYIYTAAPGVYDGDSGELAAAVNTLGLAHPTGFPLYMLSGKLFTLLVPIKDIAYRLNIFSSLLTATALAFFYYTLKNLGNSSFASLTASFILGLGRNTIWANSGRADVYALSLLFVSVLFFIFSKWKSNPDTKHFYLYGFLWGLSLGTHALMLIMGIPFLFMLWQARPFLKSHISVLIKTAIITILPGVQYFYLLFAYKRNGIVNWGSMASFHDLINYITQRDYTFKMFAYSSSYLGGYFSKLFSLLLGEFGILIIISLCGLIYVFKKDRSLFAIFGLVTMANAFMMLSYGQTSELLILYHYVFLIDLILAITFAFGFDLLIKSIEKNRRFVTIFGVFMVLAVSYQAVHSFNYNNRRHNYIFEDFARNALIGVDHGSIVFIGDDPVVGPLWYLQTLGERKDVTVISLGLLKFDWYIRNLMKKYPWLMDQAVLEQGLDATRLEVIILHNINRRKIYTSVPNWDDYAKSNFYFVPVGTLYAILLRGSDNDFIGLTQLNRSIWDQYELRNTELNDHPDFMVNILIRRYSLALADAGVASAAVGLVDNAIYFTNKSIDMAPSDQAKQKIKALKK